MKTRVILKAGSLVMLAALVAGCGRATDVTVYEPGVYKGPKDPLLKVHATAEHKATLQQRFSKGQSDR